MDDKQLKALVREIVKQATELKDKHTTEKKARVNYACIFTQSEKEYETLLAVAKQSWNVIEDTPTGPLFHIDPPLETIAGTLKLLKIRFPDKTHPDRGDADFTVSDYPTFKTIHLSKLGFKLMVKHENFEMIELMDPKFNVRAYFSHPPLDQELGL